MKINRDIYLEPFTKNNFSLPCSVCGNGILEFVMDTFKEESTKESNDYQSLVGCEPEALDIRFVSILRCGNKNCCEIATINGTAKVEEDQSDSYKTDYFSIYSIDYINPPVHIIKIPEGIPASVKEMLISSFSLFWHDAPSAGNKIRKTIELVLDKKKIDQNGVGKSGRNFPLNLHQRIEIFASIESKKYKELADILMGIKWLGNESSHRDENLQREDLLDAYDVLAYVLDEIFTRDTSRLDAKNKAQKLTSKYSK